MEDNNVITRDIMGTLDEIEVLKSNAIAQMKENGFTLTDTKSEDGFLATGDGGKFTIVKSGGTGIAVKRYILTFTFTAKLAGEEEALKELNSKKVETIQRGDEKSQQEYEAVIAEWKKAVGSGYCIHVEVNKGSVKQLIRVAYKRQLKRPRGVPYFYCDRGLVKIFKYSAVNYGYYITACDIGEAVCKKLCRYLEDCGISAEVRPFDRAAYEKAYALFINDYNYPRKDIYGEGIMDIIKYYAQYKYIYNYQESAKCYYEDLQWLTT